MRNKLRIGDKIITTSGIFGSVVQIDDSKNVVSIEVAKLTGINSSPPIRRNMPRNSSINLLLISCNAINFVTGSVIFNKNSYSIPS